MYPDAGHNQRTDPVAGLTGPRPDTPFEAKARAEARRVDAKTQARIAEADAAAERKLRERRAGEQLKEKRRQADLKRREEGQDRRETAKQRRREYVQSKRAAVRSGFASVGRHIRANTAGVVTAVIYVMAVATAAHGQFEVAQGWGWGAPLAVALAVFIEGFALSMALTAHRMRMDGERGTLPRVLTWVAAACAAGFQFIGHADDHGKAAALAAASIGAIVAWEIRTSALSRKALRDKEMISDPPVRFGWRVWLCHPILTGRAWRFQVIDRLTGQARVVFETVKTDRDARNAERKASKAAQKTDRDARNAERKASKAAQKAARAADNDPAGAAPTRSAAEGAPTGSTAETVVHAHPVMHTVKSRNHAGGAHGAPNGKSAPAQPALQGAPNGRKVQALPAPRAAGASGVHIPPGAEAAARAALKEAMAQPGVTLKGLVKVYVTELEKLGHTPTVADIHAVTGAGERTIKYARKELRALTSS